MTPNLNMRRGLSSRLGRTLLGLLGWRVVFAPPPGPKAVVIVYPHTSNWDFPIGILARMRACYAGRRGKMPGREGDIRFR